MKNEVSDAIGTAGGQRTDPSGAERLAKERKWYAVYLGQWAFFRQEKENHLCQNKIAEAASFQRLELKAWGQAEEVRQRICRSESVHVQNPEAAQVT